MGMTEWQMVDAIAAVVSTIAIVASASFVVVQLRQAARHRYFEVTSHLFEIWHSPEFQDDQLFILHKLGATNWDDFIKEGRGERAERAFHRVGTFYERVGSLIRNHLLNQDDVLPTIAGYAIAVWNRIEPLVQEARRRENAYLFQNFESMLPECRECYVPLPDSKRDDSGEVERIEPAEARVEADSGKAVILDVGKSEFGERIKGALRAQPNELTGWLSMLPPGKDVITYCT
jgi:hypothetical protein